MTVPIPPITDPPPRYPSASAAPSAPLPAVPEELVELHDVLLKAARRCAYDLSHALDMVTLPEADETQLLPAMRARCNLWIDIFAGADGLKDYRNRLHRRIEELEWDLLQAETALKKHGIEHERRRAF